MVVNDPIADMLTRIRNAQIAKHDAVVLPASNTKKAIAKILLEEGYVKNRSISSMTALPGQHQDRPEIRQRQVSSP